MIGPPRPELFHSSRFNFDPVVTGGERIRRPITITDVTLREGQQAAEVVFGPDDEVQIAEALTAIGVPVIQVGFAGADDAIVRRIRAACPGARISVLAVGWQPEAGAAMASARRAGADVCSILFRAGEAHLANLGYSHDAAIERIRALVDRAVELGYPEVVVDPSFCTSATFDFLMRLYAEARDAGATVLSLSDSLGIAKPEAIAHLVESMRGVGGDAGIRVHMHNDFGLALANTLAGITAGADWADVTVNGLGERAGNCPLDELVLALEALYGVTVGVRTESLVGLSELVTRLSGVPVAPMKPVVGADVFANKLEIHLKAAMSDPALMEPYDPAAVGNQRTVKLGRGTGPTGVGMKLAALDLELPPELVDAAVARIGELARRTKRSVSDDEFRSLVAELRSALA